MLAAAAKAAEDETTTSRLEKQREPLQWTTEKLGPAVSVAGDGKSVSRQASGCAAQLTDVWIRGGKKPLVWTVAIALDEVLPDTVFGVVGRNFWPSDWSTPLTDSQYAVVVRCGDGRVHIKGRESSFILRQLSKGSKVNLVMDMQVQELTVEVLGKEPGVVLGSINIEGIPAELAVAVGFTSGGPQSVRIVGCVSERPEMKLLGKLRKDLWDDDNIQTPLPLNYKKERGPLQMHLQEIAVAASLDS